MAACSFRRFRQAARAAQAQIQKGDILVGVNVGERHWETIRPDNILFILRQPRSPSRPCSSSTSFAATASAPLRQRCRSSHHPANLEPLIAEFNAVASGSLPPATASFLLTHRLAPLLSPLQVGLRTAKSLLSDFRAESPDLQRFSLVLRASLQGGHWLVML